MESLRSGRAVLLFAAIVFAAGTIGLPTLHLSFHSGDHTHDGAASAGHGTEHHRHPHPDPAPSDPRHGEGSGAHFSVAISDAPACTIEPAIHDLEVSAPLIARSQNRHVADAHIAVDRFRGPPAAG